ncbi:MAG: isoprenylcysteine carboxylmethyltransferase family protein [Proteobacteria bacterium]|jgi:protein-S-isoprenylcysteine O-methyltransferase Ste14|nr:isoprenylcysteine carboxylmethyltransferase family protein [Pseudomonadota bacterium]
MVIWLPVCSVLGIYLARMVELRAKRNTLPGQVRETRTLTWFITTGTLMLVGALGEFYWRKAEWNPTLFGLGWACALASIGIRRSAITALGQFWSLHVEIRETHQFVRTGPFRWMRHPTYFSMILELLSAAFILQAPATLMVVTLFFVPALVERVRLEETALVEKFGEAYRAYQQSTPAVIPWKGQCT